MSYQVPQYINGNKIFLVNRSEIEGRLDPSVYKPHFKFVSKAFRNVKLSGIAWIDPSCIFKNIEEVSFIPMDAIDSSNGIISYQGIKKVEETKGFTRFKEGDILWAKITPCMQNAKSAIAKKLINGYGCGSTEFFVIRSKDKSVVLQEYLLFLLRDERILKTAMNYFGGSAGQQRVSPLFLKTFNVPLPEIEEQKRYCVLLKNAQILKRQKEQQAEDILNSIDDYLLGELGIKLPEMESQTLQNRIFVVSRRVLEDRLDPYYSQQYFRNAFEVLGVCKYPVVNLKEISKLITSGITPKSGGDAYTEDKSIGVPFVRSGNISIDGELNYDDLVYLKPEIHENVMSSSKLKKDDILIAIVGATIGQVGIYLSEGEANINQAIALVRLKEGYNAQFVKELIKSSIGQLSLNRLKRPVARANINLEEISRIKVVLPPEEKQEEIVEHITAIRQQAKVLQEEGKEIFERAKREVERMILG
jgi:type I restriction enzyme S subunit